MFRYISSLAILIFTTFYFSLFTLQFSLASGTHSHRHAHSYHADGHHHHEVASFDIPGDSIFDRLRDLTSLEKVLLICVLVLMGMIIWLMWPAKKPEAAPAPAPEKKEEEKKEEKAEEKSPAPPSPPAQQSSFGAFQIAMLVMAGIVIVLLALILYTLMPG